MTRWLAILLPLSLLGQTPNPGAGTEPVAPLPSTDELDPATREQRDAVEAARDEADTFDTPGVTPMYPPTPATPDPVLSGPEVSGPEVGFGGSGTATPETTGTGEGADTPAAATPGGAAAPQQTAPGATAGPPTAAGTGTQQAGPDRPPTPEEMAEQLQQLQGQVQSLEQQLEAREEQLSQSEEATASLQQNMSALQSNAQELERLRQQRLGLIQRAWAWMLAADNALVTGELAVDEALRQADLSLGDALENASVAGENVTVQLMRNARQFVSAARTAVDNRDVYNARLQLQSAGQSLGRARERSLAQTDVSLVTPPATQSPAPAGSAGGQ